MRRAITAALLASIPVNLSLAAATFAKDASDGGEGLAGETDDKVVTFFSFGVIVFFVVVALLLSIAQRALEKRKEEKKAASLHQRIGW